MTLRSEKPTIESIQWPKGIDEQSFLNEYWQKRPLLIRQAFPQFKTPLVADELAGLSLEPDVASKIISCDQRGDYHLEFGPFDEDRFEQLTDPLWSLLVTDVEKSLPELSSYIEPFRFLPDWRIDDLMISYAPDRASVGAHIDEYDVFLLQASGIRCWSIDARTNTAHQLREQGDLKILQKFDATDTWELLPGDMLYLPPGIAHHGIAKGSECTTWSIGFRAPLISEMIARISELLSEKISHRRFQDGSLQPAVQGEISAEVIAQFKQLWDEATSVTSENFANMLGQWLTESTTTDEFRVAGEQSSGGNLVCKAPGSRFAWIEKNAASATLFVDGSAFDCSMELAWQLCQCSPSNPFDITSGNHTDAALIQALVCNGNLQECS